MVYSSKVLQKANLGTVIKQGFRKIKIYILPMKIQHHVYIKISGHLCMLSDYMKSRSPNVRYMSL